MNDLISRAAAIAKVERARKAARTLTGMDFVMMLKDQPAVDAVPVVRCKNCKYWDADWKPNNVQDGVHFCPMVSLVRRGDWFCADGERRDDDAAGGR